MPRQKRPYAPGAFFHLGARTQGATKWFTPEFKTYIVGYIADASEGCDVDLCNYVVMDNHIHLIVRQRTSPLGHFVQPLLRRCALLVKRYIEVKGHVFGASFWHRRCHDPHDLRTCIGYVHRNPLKAKLCGRARDYIWSSSADYENCIPSGWSGRRPQLFMLHELIASSANTPSHKLRRDYVKFLNDSVTEDGKFSPSLDAYHRGDDYWRELQNDFSDVVKQPPRARTDLRDVVRRGMATLCPDLDIEMVRTFRGAFISSVRGQLVIRASRAGHRGCDIARFLHMSDSRVSEIVRRLPVRTRNISIGR